MCWFCFVIQKVCYYQEFSIKTCKNSIPHKSCARNKAHFTTAHKKHEVSLVTAQHQTCGDTTPEHMLSFQGSGVQFLEPLGVTHTCLLVSAGTHGNTHTLNN